MIQSAPTPFIQSVDGRLRIEFRWEVDRYHQYLSLSGVQVGVSREGDCSEAWPPSPPLQQLSIETIKGHPTALGVGAAGRGHWSLSGEPDPNRPSAIQFELACRCQESAQYLGSLYEVADSICVETIDGKIDFQTTDEQRKITIRPRVAATTCRWSYRIEPA